VPRVQRTWRLVIAYRGGDFVGWQRQVGHRSVEQTLIDALRQLTEDDVSVRAAGRTDSGVHARGQVASCTITSSVKPRKMALALGAQLPDDVAVVEATEAAPGFDAKRHSVAKRYVYRVLDRTARDPFRSETSWHVRGGLDLDAMRTAAAALVGENDYESFRSTHCDAAHARRYLWRVDVARADEDLVAIEVRGNAFCRNMVRIIAGTLVDVGVGRTPAGDVRGILAARDRTLAGQTAPARGLTLEEVYYPDTVDRAEIPAGATFPGWPVSEETWPPRVESDRE
jgi:tRNA pseudouridine38-40 synthase